MSQREQYTKQKLYEEAFNVCFNWEQFLTPRCFEFHDLMCRETNSPIPLQMGVMLPFVSACLGPTTRGCFLTRPSVLNLFWLNVAASGVGKSETRKRLISEPLEYIFSQPECHISDFEVSKFTRAGKVFLFLFLIVAHSLLFYFTSIRQKYTTDKYIFFLLNRYCN